MADAATPFKLETLKRRVDFLRLKQGRRWTSPAFILQMQPQEIRSDAAISGPRFGFTVSDRAIATVEESGRKRGGAVKRNRARRRLKEAVRIVAPRAARPGFDYAVIGRQEALERDFADLLADMELAFHKVHDETRNGRAIRSRDPGGRQGRSAAMPGRKGTASKAHANHG
jgi:ribonuclease P protein component